MDLDNIAYIKKLDRSNMYSYLCSMGKDTFDTYLKIKTNNFFNFKKDIKNILCIGMGGSGMVPIVLNSLFKDELIVPCIISQRYHIPRFVSQDTFLIAISDSGETEETLSQYEQAKEKGVNIIVIGQKGKLIEAAKKDNIPYFTYSTPVPARSSFAFIFGYCIGCLENIGLIEKNKEQSLTETIKILNSLNEEINIYITTDKNFAKRTSLILDRYVPILYIEPPFESIGPRFSKMLSENAKKFAFYNYFPEMRHNEIMSWTLYNTEKFIPILLRDNEKYSKMEREIDEIKKLLSNVIEFRAIGDSKIARFYSLLHLMDMISFYSAVLENKDPSDTAELKQLRNRIFYVDRRFKEKKK